MLTTGRSRCSTSATAVRPRVVQEANANHIRAVHAFIDPSLRRVSSTWDDLDVPPRLRELAQATWEKLDRLADPDGDTPAVHDAARRAARRPTRELYAEAEAIAAVLDAGRPPRRPGHAARRRPTPSSSAAPTGVPAPACARWCRRARGAACARRSARSADAGAHPWSRHPLPWRAIRPTTCAGRGTTPSRRRPCGPGLTCVFRVKDEARNLPWVLPRHARGGASTSSSSTTAPTDGTPEVAAARGGRGRRRRTATPARRTRTASAGRAPSTSPRRPDSVHSLTHFYNWSFAHVRTTYSMKWDGDMVLTPEGVGVLQRPVWQLSARARWWRCPRHPLVWSRATRWRGSTSASRFLEPWVYPMGPTSPSSRRSSGRCASSPPTSERIVAPEGLCVELKWLDADEFAHWSPIDDFADSRVQRKRREQEVDRALREGRGRRASRGCTGSRPRPASTSSTTSCTLAAAGAPAARAPRGRVDV